MEVKLIVIGGKRPGQEIPVTKAKFFIGRAEDCHLRPQSDMVSRRHCAIVVEEALVTVRDFGSKNGTFVNGERVTGERELKAGDRLKVGPLEFDVQLIVGVSGKKKPKVKSVQEAAARTVQAASGDDLDISHWLDDDDDTVAGARVTETLITPSAPLAAEAPPEDEAEQQPKKDEPAVKVVGRFQKDSDKVRTGSSRSAAADMLQQFFDHK